MGRRTPWAHRGNDDDEGRPEQLSLPQVKREKRRIAKKARLQAQGVEEPSRAQLHMGGGYKRQCIMLCRLLPSSSFDESTRVAPAIMSKLASEVV